MAAIDNYSDNIFENPVHIRGTNATLFHCLSIDQNRFTFRFIFRFQCLDQKLTGVESAHSIKSILS